MFRHGFISAGGEIVIHSYVVVLAASNHVAVFYPMMHHGSSSKVHILTMVAESQDVFSLPQKL